MVSRMRTVWYDKELYVLNRNRIVDLLIRKADRAEAFWARMECWFRRLWP
jgi:hypothetical protein